MSRLLVTVAALLFAAHSFTAEPPIQPYGPDQFVTYTKSKSAAKAHESAVARANKYCEASGKHMMPIEDKKIGRGQFEFRFSCK
ncbi:MAG TPA: hypothetical protein VET48_05750 [Steroidobacteraceae bacterium]|nr:hypothetical protein [Steroidobacteraceae bacterium]